MALRKYFTIILTLSVFFATCKSDEDPEKENGTITEITNDTSQTEDNSEKIPATETDSDEQNTYITDISSKGDFYAHFENKKEEMTAELFCNSGSIILMLSTNNADREESLNGDMLTKLEFNVKGITDARGVQAIFDGKITDDNKLKLKNRNTGKEYLLEQNYNSGVAFKFYSLDKENETEAGTLTDDMKLLFPIQSNKYPELESLILRHFFDKKKGSPDDLLEKSNNELFTSLKENGAGGFWNREMSCDILYNNNNIISYGIHSYSYTGGAHGNGASSYFMFDLKNKKEVKLKDIFGSADFKKLSTMIYNEIKKSREFSDSEMKAEYELPIEPTTNFYITPKGLYFVYNAYDLTSYALGSDAVFFSFTTINKKLDTDFFDNL